MKGTEQFKAVIQNHLNELAANDPLFAQTLNKENKNIDECINYILGEVRKSGCNGFADEEIFNMAIHYYDEDDIKVGKVSVQKIVINHTDFKGTKAQAQQKQKNQATTDKKKKVVKLNPNNQVSLFDFPGV